MCYAPDMPAYVDFREFVDAIRVFNFSLYPHAVCARISRSRFSIFQLMPRAVFLLVKEHLHILEP